MADWNRVVRERLKELGLTAAAEAALAEELAEHLEDLYQDRRAVGVSEAEAYEEAVSELEDVDALRADVKARQQMPAREPVSTGRPSSRTLIGAAIADLRYAGRMMRKNPSFVCVVVTVLGLGIGATTTVFTAVNALLLNPMPVAAPSELVAVGTASAAGASQRSGLTALSYPNFQDYKRNNRVFSSLSAFTTLRPLTWQTQGNAQALLGEFVTGDFFATLGVGAAVGRTFGEEVDSRDGREAVAMINFGTWQRRFGGAPDIVGRQLTLNGTRVTIVGVAPSGFIGVNGLVGPDVWLPMAFAEQAARGDIGSSIVDRGKPLVNGVARLRKGVTLDEAQANVEALASGLAREYPLVNQTHSAVVRPIADVLFGGGSRMVRFAGIVLASVAALVLMIACSNAANLLLARSASRQQEIAVRLALGASRTRIVRQLLTESLCFGLIGGVVGVLAAYASIQLLASALPATSAFMVSRIDATVLMFACVTSVTASLIFGTVPAFGASRAGVTEVLGGTRMVGRGARRVTVVNSLLVAQVAVSFLLLITAALFVRSIQRAYRIDPGFEAAHLAVFVTTPGQSGFTDAEVQNFYQQLRQRVQSLPGVESVSWASNMPLFARPISGLQIEGRVAQTNSEAADAIVNTVDRGYFRTMAIPIVEGRALGDIDTSSSRPVVVVNERLARDFWPGGNALGKRLRVPGELQLREVVGVARNANYSTWGETPQPCVYVPLDQNPMPAMTLYVRSRVEPAQVVNAVRREISSVGPQVLVAGVRTGDQVIDGSLFQARMGVTLLGAFGVIALLLASVGLYGLLAFAVQERRREIGVRMALGASTAGVLKLIVTQGMSLVAVGMAIGLAAALMVGRLLRAMLYGVGPTDPLSLVVATGVLCGVALVACYLPARWAARVNPLEALRDA